MNGASERPLAGSFLASDQEGRVGRSRDAGLGHRAPDLEVGAFHLTLGIFGSPCALEVSDLITWPTVANQTLDDGRDLIGRRQFPGASPNDPRPSALTADAMFGFAVMAAPASRGWIVPNSYQLDQLIFKLERELDTVQTDHIDFGFRSVSMYGMDYRYTTAGGWFSDQLLRHNSLYGYDPVEQYFEIYIPRIWQGMVIRVGRWIACPDIEVQSAGGTPPKRILPLFRWVPY